MEKMNFEYIVIGAGPSGLQLGYFLQKSGLDYCILEKGSGSGSFFKKYPRHRKLISINKVYTGYTDPELNLRWDWNSLLSDSPELLVKNYSKEYFPKSDDLVRYLQDFSDHYKLNIHYDTEVEEITKNTEDLFCLTTKNISYTCKYLIIATGVPKQIVPDIDGIEHGEFYSDCSMNPEDYEDKKVLIIGKGNSGFEIADNLVSTASRIHLLSPNNITFAWKTHYVGNLRAINNNHLDTYLLKSQNAVLNAEIHKISRNENGKYNVIVDYTKVRGGEIEEFEYDHIIIACGFKMDSSLFSEAIKPELSYNDKFPNLTCEWESSNIRDLYFAGILSHSRDFKKSTSGFIHGFRYNCKALVNILLQKNQGKAIRAEVLDKIDIDEITHLIIQKINRTSALWQQFGFLGDVLIIHEETNQASYIDALPCDYINEKLCKDQENYFVITLEYGTRAFNPFAENVERINRFDSESAEESDFIHPVLKRYSRGRLISEKHLIENFHSEFDREEHLVSLHNFLTGELVGENTKIQSVIP